MEAKQAAAARAVAEIKNGMTIALGTGSTAYWAIQEIGDRVAQGLDIKAVASSLRSENLARERKIPIADLSGIDRFDIDIDGADEVDQDGNLIKGGGGALLREKILAANSRKFLVIVDGSKLVDQLGKVPLPVEIVPFGSALTLKNLERMEAHPSVRQLNGKDYISENGNLIADCRFQTIADPAALNRRLHEIPGIVETGLFLHTMVHSVFVGYADGAVRIIGTSTEK
jgi:ribose 5-phosphate isomerase A